MEWQPARFRVAHVSDEVRVSQAAIIAKAESVVIRVRKGPKGYGSMQRPCNADNWFEIHPDDVRKLGGTNVGSPVVVCEHEILTD